MNSVNSTSIIKKIAYELGFQFCGISKAEFLAEEAPHLEKWLKDSKHGKMSYMENHFDMRLDPRLLVPGAKSVVSLIYNYYPEQKQQEDSYKVSKYAYGTDYHFVLKEKLKLFLERIRYEIGEVDGRVFVDSAPVMDKVWAKKSGLGWVGKHSNLIHPKKGSFFFIAELIIDLELEADGPIKDYCGTCTRCIDACPTDAIVQPYVVDGSKCISYLTIELKDEVIPSEFTGKMNDWIFGCDICQDVCPINARAQQHKEPEFEDKSIFSSMHRSIWEEITEDNFNEVFHDSPIKRTGYKGLMRNLEFSKQVKS